jgi:aminomuconate-semialdehyde/2-hydroxymuconate-6-semialdehyde dehydrogenase
MEVIQNYIGGKFQAAYSGEVIEVYNPAKGEVYASAPNSDKIDMETAIKAAEEAFPAWSQLSIEKRSDYLMKISTRISAQLEDLALAESIDNGKPLWLAKKVDIPRAASNMKFFANAITQFASESHEMVGHAINYTLRSPLGVVGCISPWNLPLYLFTWKIAPALAAGNTVVAKPSEVTPMTAYLFAKIADEVGLPAGVLNIVHGLGHKTAAVLSSHTKVKAVSFTGSTRVGAEIARTAAPLFKKYSLEMGGKNPNIIFEDCDYEKALRTTVNSSFANQGQICLCGSKIFVQRGIYKKFKEDLVALANKRTVGDPLHGDTKMGAIVSKPHFDKVLSHIEIAKGEGGQILCGGQAVQPEGFENGWFIAPTVIEGLEPYCQTNKDEIFGPVVSIMPFDTEAEVIHLANDNDYGLSMTLWTENLSRAHRMAAQLEAGILWVNTWLLRDLRTPFGGMKNSGVGREGGFDALKFFTEQKNVCIEYGK